MDLLGQQPRLGDLLLELEIDQFQQPCQFTPANMIQPILVAQCLRHHQIYHGIQRAAGQANVVDGINDVDCGWRSCFTPLLGGDVGDQHRTFLLNHALQQAFY